MEWSKLLSLKTQISREKEPKEWASYPINCLEKDYQSIISSAAFRRLQDKTQVFPLDKSDFVRTRLTHSLEVSTVARQLGIMVTQNDNKFSPQELSENKEIANAIPSVLSCAGLLHDLGNPPFGHFGEVVIGDWFENELKKDSFSYKGTPIRNILNSHMKKDLCNFEGNAQALRILSKIRHNPDGYDANLTFGVMNTLIKYPTDSEHVNKLKTSNVKQHKVGYYLSEFELFDDICVETGTKLDEGNYARHPLTYLMEAADDIAYATSDLEDALKKGVFTVEQFIGFYKTKLSELSDNARKKKSEELINNLEERLNAQSSRTKENDIVTFQKWTVYVKEWLMYVVAYSFSKNYSAIMSGSYTHDMLFEGFHRHTIEILKSAMVEFVFSSPEILKLELSAQKIIGGLLEDFIYAVIYWEDSDDKYKLTKAQEKCIKIISENYKIDYLKSRDEDGTNNLYLRFLMVTDYISGMTDSFAKNLYQELNGIN